MRGKRLADTPIGQFPVDYDELEPGDYWKVLKPDGSEPLDVHKPDGHYWGTGPTIEAQYRQNLTGTVWGVIDPNGSYGMLSIHTVREEDDGTISIRLNDGSSNSVKITHRTPEGEVEWHGYIEHGEWREL